MRTRHRILILIDEILGDILHHELVGLLRHPCVHKRREIEQRVSVEGKLVVDKLVSFLCAYSLGSLWMKFSSWQHKR